VNSRCSFKPLTFRCVQRRNHYFPSLLHKLSRPLHRLSLASRSKSSDGSITKLLLKPHDGPSDLNARPPRRLDRLFKPSTAIRSNRSYHSQPHRSLLPRKRAHRLKLMKVASACSQHRSRFAREIVATTKIEVEFVRRCPWPQAAQPQRQRTALPRLGSWRAGVTGVRQQGTRPEESP